MLLLYLITLKTSSVSFGIFTSAVLTSRFGGRIAFFYCPQGEKHHDTNKNI